MLEVQGNGVMPHLPKETKRMFRSLERAPRLVKHGAGLLGAEGAE